MILTEYKKGVTVRTAKVRVRVCDICQSRKNVYRFVGMWCDKKRKYLGSNMPIRHTRHTDRCEQHLKELTATL